jgi:hypothetical protein
LNMAMPKKIRKKNKKKKTGNSYVSLKKRCAFACCEWKLPIGGLLDYLDCTFRALGFASSAD